MCAGFYGHPVLLKSPLLNLLAGSGPALDSFSMLIPKDVLLT